MVLNEIKFGQRQVTLEVSLVLNQKQPLNLRSLKPPLQTKPRFAPDAVFRNREDPFFTQADLDFTLSVVKEENNRDYCGLLMIF